MIRMLRIFTGMLGLMLGLSFSALAFQDSKTDKGLPSIAVSALPKEARETLALIKKGGPFPYSKDGTTFSNREGLLPKKARGFYREYTVKTPGAKNRGARRIVAGGEVYYYTDDHYASFKRIQE
jgi:ribonuclease T1